MFVFEILKDTFADNESLLFIIGIKIFLDSPTSVKTIFLIEAVCGEVISMLLSISLELVLKETSNSEGYPQFVDKYVHKYFFPVH